MLLAAFADGEVVGTAQVILALMPNQPHRGEIAKVLVHRSARRRGIAEQLMERAEAEARAEGRRCWCWTPSPATRPRACTRDSGWTTVGVVPNFALYPDGSPCDTTYFFKAI